MGYLAAGTNVSVYSIISAPGSLRHLGGLRDLHTYSGMDTRRRPIAGRRIRMKGRP